MARELKPCGTVAAARRHRRRGEPLCDACRQAERDQKNNRVRVKMEASAEAVKKAVAQEPEVEEVDALAEALDSLRIIRAVLRDGETPANAVAGLTRRRDELVDRIEQLRQAQVEVKAVSAVDEITSRRRRRAASQN